MPVYALVKAGNVAGKRLKLFIRKAFNDCSHHRAAIILPGSRAKAFELLQSIFRVLTTQ